MSARIASIVINSVSHDARVLKQADSLAGAGHEVTIIGIRDNRCDDPRTARREGVEIIRVDWKRSTYVVIAWLIAAAGVLVIGAALLAHALLFDPVFDAVAAMTWRDAARLVTALLVVPIAVLFYREWRRTRDIVRRLTPDGPPAATRSGARLTRWLARRDRLRRRLHGLVSTRVIRRAIVRELVRIRPDVVHCHDLSALPAGLAYKRRVRCKVVYDSHEIHEELSLATAAQRRRSARRQRRWSGRVDGFVTINDSIGEYLARKYPALPAPVIVKNAAVLRGEVADDGRLREAADVAEDRRILLYQGGFARLRGLDVLVRAAPALPEEWVLVMMGWGAYEPTLRSIAAQVDPAGARVRFIPSVPQHELASWTAGASLGAIPYENVCLNHWFCTPNKLWEYPIARVPILASPFPEMRKIVCGWEVGWLLDDPVTPEGIARTVASITEEELRAKRENCDRFVREDNWSVYARRLTEAYAGLLNGAAAPAAS